MKHLQIGVTLVAAMGSVADAQIIHEFDILGGARSVTGIGDIDSDGSNDFAVAEPQQGFVRLFSGRDASLLANIAANAPEYGAAMDAGDVTGDGRLDLIIGSPLFGSPVNKGEIHVYDHADGSLVINIAPTGADAYLGRSVSIAGDVNADGSLDFIAGVDSYARVFSGSTGVLLKYLPPPMGSNDFGFSVGGGCDLDLDGYDDVIVGAPGTSAAGLGAAGQTLTFSAGKSYSTLMNLLGSGINERLGDVVQISPDLNGDGIPDALVVSRTMQLAPPASGAIRVAPGPYGAPILWAAPIHSPSGGRTFDIVPDQDGDGFADVVVSRVGAVALLSGATGAVINQLFYPSPQGFQLADVGDVNCDGLTDVVAIYSQGGVVYSHSCGQIQSYGTACPGFGGAAPLLSVAGCGIALGSHDISISNAIGPSYAVILVGTGKASTPISGSCSLLLSGVLPNVITLPLAGTGAVGSGHGGFEAKLPCFAAGLSITLQAFIFDSTTALGYSATQGVELLVL